MVTSILGFRQSAASDHGPFFDAVRRICNSWDSGSGPESASSRLDRLPGCLCSSDSCYSSPGSADDAPSVSPGGAALGSWVTEAAEGSWVGGRRCENTCPDSAHSCSSKVGSASETKEDDINTKHDQRPSEELLLYSEFVLSNLRKQTFKLKYKKVRISNTLFF